MVIQADLVIHSARQLVTCAGAGTPKRGAALRDVGLIEDGALAVKDGRIAAVGGTKDVRAAYRAENTLDASGKVVCPGLVDCHTHVVYAGERISEFEMRLNGTAYLDILAAGGGILNTVRATRAASEDDLYGAARKRLEAMQRLGTTLAEIKTGYGLDTNSELKLLRVIARLGKTFDVVPTFLGAHAVPPEYVERADAYVDLVVSEMLPAVWDWYRESCFAGKTPFYVDVFCEQNAFSEAQARRILDAGRRIGMRVKAHVDEFNVLGGVPLALALGAASVDHLDVTGLADVRVLGKSNTAAVVMPMVNFHLATPHYANARALADSGAVLALATDLNPGSAPCYSLPLVMATACRQQKLLPSEVLNACTLNAAYAIGALERAGSLETGKQADALILDASDYRVLAYELGGNPVQTVIKRGKVV